jgi:hypothetical protein
MTNARLLAILTEQPLCLACLAEKSGSTVAEVDIALLRIAEEVEILAGMDRCQACFRADLTYARMRRA